jgi:transcriptional regulator with XRE-family HTH domain
VVYIYPISVLLFPVAKVLKALGANIRRYRKERGLTQERLAELAEIDPKYCGQLERGEVNVSVLTLQRVAKALKQPLTTLLVESD